MWYLHPYNLAFYKNAVEWLICNIFYLKYRLKRTFAINFCLSITNFVFENLFSVETCFVEFLQSEGLRRLNLIKLITKPFLIPSYVSI